MSLFIWQLAFPGYRELIDETKIGIPDGIVHIGGAWFILRMT
jgi:hypothetical protein